MRNKRKIILVALSLSVIAVLLIWGCLNSIAIPDDQIGDYVSSIVWDGLKRTYFIHIPYS